MDSRSSSPSPMLAVLHAPESPDLPLSSSANKRRRDPSPPPSAALFEDETAKEKTRRVNPYRLAERLGSDLVAELEAFIYPGAKMPSYNERKVVQDKYLVDRRHIYDYLHSRGLRVAKEDRHLNLYRNRMQQGPRPPSKKPKPLPPARPRTPKIKKQARVSAKAPILVPNLTPVYTSENSTSTPQDRADTVGDTKYLTTDKVFDSPSFSKEREPSIKSEDYYEIDELGPEQAIVFDPISIKDRFTWKPKTPPPVEEPLLASGDSCSSVEEYSLDSTLADELLSSWLDLDALAEPVTHSPNDNSAPLILEDEISSMYDLIDSSLSSSSLLHASSGSYMTHMQDMSMQQKVSTVVPQPHHSPPSSRRAHSTNAAQAASSSLHPIAESATASNKENLPSALHFANSYYYPIPTSGTQPHGTKSYHIPDIHRTALAGHTLNAPYAAVANQPFMSQPYSAGVIGHHRGFLSIHNIGH